MSEQKIESPIMSKSEGAAYIKSSESFLHAHATRAGKSPRIPFIRVGNKLRFRKADLDTFLETCAARTTVKA